MFVNRSYFSHKNQCKMDESVPGPQVIAYLNFATALCTHIHKQNHWKSLNETQENARRIQAGMYTEPKLTSNWHSRADILSLPLLPACVFVIRETVRHPRLFCSENLFVNRIVGEQGRSWTEAPLYTKKDRKYYVYHIVVFWLTRFILCIL
jgi:hypothetical protein